jgi:hypothetical protein
LPRQVRGPIGESPLLLSAVEQGAPREARAEAPAARELGRPGGDLSARGLSQKGRWGLPEGTGNGGTPDRFDPGSWSSADPVRDGPGEPG